MYAICIFQRDDSLSGKYWHKIEIQFHFRKDEGKLPYRRRDR